MGVVYRALDTALRRQVALKVLPPDRVSDDSRVALRYAAAIADALATAHAVHRDLKRRT